MKETAITSSPGINKASDRTFLIIGAERQTSAVRGCMAGFSVFIFRADPEERIVRDLP